MHDKKAHKVLKIVFLIIASVAFLTAIYFLPPVHNRIAWRLASLRAKFFYALNPPGEANFSPEQQAELDVIVQQTQTAMASGQVVSDEAKLTPTYAVSPTPTHTSAPTQSPTPIPDAVQLTGVVHEYQSMNNCGPATLSMALSFWGWEGDQRNTKQWLRIHPDDRNIMPGEMVASVIQQTDLSAMVRWGGDIEVIKKFIAAGYPVIIERDMGDVRPNEDWTGHFGVITAYDDSRGRVRLQDSYISSDYPLAYESLIKYWRAFNYVYVVIYPPEEESKILSILGPHADEAFNHQHAAQLAEEESAALTGRDLFFTWFNLGTSKVNLGEYFEAAQAYDYAFDVVYPTIPDLGKPWRMMWYQTGPYEAYYYTGRYQAVKQLADFTLANTGVSEIEETWLWRGRARLALGDQAGAIEDFRAALKYHPGWWEAEAELRELGVAP